MKILVQDKTTHLFLRNLGDWVKASDQAVEFSHTASALDFCLLHHLSNVQIILTFDVEGYDLEVDLDHDPVREMPPSHELVLARQAG